MKKFNLDKEPKIATGFKMPENYFESFEVKMLAQIPKHETKVIAFSVRKLYVVSAIAAVLLAFIAIPFYFNSNVTSDSISIESYLSYQLTTEDIIEKLTQEDIDALENTLALSDDGLEEYLSETQNLKFYLNE
jgi:hypothetical protein